MHLSVIRELHGGYFSYASESEVIMLSWKNNFSHERMRCGKKICSCEIKFLSL